MNRSNGKAMATGPLSPVVDGNGAQVRENRRMPRLTILSHPDPTRIGAYADLEKLLEGTVVLLSRSALDFVQPPATTGMPLDDPFLSREPLRLSMDPQGNIELHPGKGRIDIKLNGNPILGQATLTPETWHHGVSLVLCDRITLWLHPGLPTSPTKPKYGLVGLSDSANQLRCAIREVLNSEAPVLLYGGPGSGKRQVAKAIHENSRRRNQPFVAVHIGGLPVAEAEARLFAPIERGYSHHGNLRQSCFSKAHKGTVFLEGLAQAEPSIQKRLLRVLKTGELNTPDNVQPCPIDVRLIVSSENHLSNDDGKGLFIEPLLDLLKGHQIEVPSLANRREDLGRLFYFFAQNAFAELDLPAWQPSPLPGASPWLPPKVMLAFLEYDWPGNVAQFQILVRQLIIGNRGLQQLSMENPALRRIAQSGAKLPTTGSAQGKSAKKLPEKEIDETALLKALRRFRWNFKATAAGLGVSYEVFTAMAAKCPQVKQVEDLDQQNLASAWQQCKGDLDQLADHFCVSRHALRERLQAMGLL